MRACNELDRLSTAHPRILQRTETVVDAAEADRILRQILASAPAPTQAGARTPGRGLARPRPAGLLAGSLGLAAAVVACAVVLASGPPAVPGSSPVTHPASGRHAPAGGHAARQVLLAAASVAAVSQDTRGRYWYVTETLTMPGLRQVQKTWTPPHGTQQWVWAGKKSGNRVLEFPSTGFSLAGDQGSLGWLENLPPVLVSARQARHIAQLRRELASYLQAHPGSLQPGVLTFDQLQKLPANPAVLTAKIATINSAAARWMPRQDSAREQMFLSLANLLAGLPVPPQVRAAAFRAMAALPGVTSLGPTEGGQGLRFGLGGNKSATLVVDPATAKVKDALTVVGAGGKVSSVSVAAQWASHLPK